MSIKVEAEMIKCDWNDIETFNLIHICNVWVFVWEILSYSLEGGTTSAIHKIYKCAECGRKRK